MVVGVYQGTRSAWTGHFFPVPLCRIGSVRTFGSLVPESIEPLTDS